MNVPSAAVAPRQRHRRKFGWLLAAFIVGCGTATTVQPERSTAATDGESTQHTAGAVALEVDFAGVQPNVVAEIPCSGEATVFQILEQAGHRDALKIESKGNGQTAFVVAINGVSNEQAKGRNWVFRVNDELAHEGCGTFVVKPGDKIQWRFGSYQPEGN